MTSKVRHFHNFFITNKFIEAFQEKHWRQRRWRLMAIKRESYFSEKECPWLWRIIVKAQKKVNHVKHNFNYHSAIDAFFSASNSQNVIAYLNFHFNKRRDRQQYDIYKKGTAAVTAITMSVSCMYRLLFVVVIYSMLSWVFIYLFYFFSENAKKYHAVSLAG